jgi:iron complex outermembrane receptor protein
MTLTSRTILCAAAALLGCLFGTRAAIGQDTELAEVVVSAQKRVQNVQDVPIAVTVVSGDTFSKANVSGFSDVAKFAPSLTVTTGDHPANSSIVIRGIGTFAFSVAAEPSVLVVVDDVAVDYQAQAFTDLVDLDRVEVLNGPQSTLFGKSASAGVVNVTTRAPSDKFTIFGDVKATNDNEQRYALSASGPLSDTLSYRVSGAVRSWEGNALNLTSGHKVNDDHSDAIRGKLRWAPDEKLSVDLAAHFNVDHAHCCAVPLTRLDPGSQLFSAPALTQDVTASGITPSLDNTAVRLNQVPLANTSDVGFSSHLAYDFGPVTFLSISAFAQFKLRDFTDYDTTDVDTLQYLTPFLNTQPPGSVPGSSTTQEHGGLLQGGRFDVKSFSQEFRLSSNGHHDFNYLFGAYYADQDLSRAFRRGLGANRAAISNYRGETRYYNYALFGQTDWQFLPRTTLITGLRLNREESSYIYDNYYKVFHLPAFGAPSSHVDSATTGKLGLQYQFTESLMAFAFAARGHKGVAYDLVTATTPEEAATFPVKAEKSDDYEVGMRSEWLDRRLVLNTTVYDTEYSNFQVQTIVPNLLNQFILTNIPKVRSRGLEVEAVAQIAAGLRANAAYAYTDAHAVTYPIGQCYGGQTVPTTCTGSPAFQDLAGATLPNAPKNKVNVGVDYARSVPALPIDADVNVSSVWQSAENFSITKDPGTVQPAYNITNLNLTLTPQRDPRFTMSLFCNNLLDKQYTVNRGNVRGNYKFPTPAGTAYTQQLPRDFERFYGIRIGFSGP